MIPAAIVIAALMVLNNWITHHNSGPTEQPFDWSFEIVNNLIIWLWWAVLLPVVARLSVALMASQTPLWMKLLVALLASIVIAMIHRYGALVIYILYFKLTSGHWLNAFGSHSLSWLFRGTIPSWIQLQVLLGSLLALSSYREKQQQALALSQLNAQLSDAELNALKMQLHPHFFFNTLNTISSLIDIDRDRAQQVIAKLGQLMRTMLDSAKRQYISLATEMDYIRDYLAIEGARFSDRLKTRMDIAPDCTSAQIPNLLLQPLVENAIKHGMATTSDAVSHHHHGQTLWR